METLVCDIARHRMEKDFNNALHDLGLFVTSIHFEDSEGLSVVVELSANEGTLIILQSGIPD